MMQEYSQMDGLNYMDCHTHLLDYPHHQDTEEVLQNAFKLGVNKIVVNTTTTNQFQGMLDLLGRHGNKIVGGFGVHPCFLQKQAKIQEGSFGQTAGWLHQLEKNLKQSSLHTVGEIGLDFRKDVLELNPKELQMEYFQKQLDLAIRMERPATIHCVRAHGQMLKIFKSLSKSLGSDKRPHLIMHSYGGSKQITKSMLKLLNLNIFFCLSLKRSTQLCSVIPLDKLICQTDCPFQNSIDLLQEQGMVGFNKYLQKVKEQVKMEQSSQKAKEEEESETIEEKLGRRLTNQPVNVIANIRSLVKFYGVDERKFINMIYSNSLKAFKLMK